MAIGPLVKGDDWIFTGTVKDRNGNLQDITGSKVYMTFKTPAQMPDPDANAAFQLSNLDIQAGDDPENDPTNGKVVLRADHSGVGVSPPDNTNIATGRYNYDFQYTDLTTGAVSTVDRGTVEVIDEVTQSN